jgi:hypothetical protein
MNSPPTPVTVWGYIDGRLSPISSFDEKISHKAIWDFFDSIGQTRRFDDAPITSVLPL